MSIRFAQLPRGACFRWRGHRYTKVSPLEGTDLDSGERRLVPRSSSVELVEDDATAQAGAAPPAKPSLLIDRQRLETAVDACLARLQRRMATVSAPLDAAQRAKLDALFRGAREDLFDQLGVANNARSADRQSSPESPDH